MRLLASAVLSFVLATSALRAGETVLRPELFVDEGKSRLLKAEPDNLRVFGAPTVRYDIGKVALPSAERSVEIRANATGPAEVELQAIYRGNINFLIGRRAILKGDKDVILNWELPKADEATSYTLTVRSSNPGVSVRVVDPSLRDASSLRADDRLAGYVSSPLRVVSAVSPVKDGKIAFEVSVPPSVRADLIGAKCTLYLADEKGNKDQQAVTLAADKDKADLARFSVNAPAWANNVTVASLALDIKGEDVSIARTAFEASPFTASHYEVPALSIEDFTATVRNGELALYATTAIRGEILGPSGAPLPTDTVWLAAGDGKTWAVQDPLLRTRRDVPWMAAGTTSFSVIPMKEAIFGMFTGVSYDGIESLASVSALNSLRLSPAAGNPGWKPAAVGTSAPLWRGNSLFNMNGARLLVGLEITPGKSTIARALVTNTLIRWIDLGPLPLPGLSEKQHELTSFTDGLDYYLLASPQPLLWKSATPIRDWEPATIEGIPEAWRRPQLLQWADKTWLFAITRRSGRGIIVWTPVEKTPTGFKVTS